MKQVLLNKGKISVSDVPAPALASRNILVEVTHSLISAGTEMTSVQLSGASLIEKARARPAEAMKVLESVKVRGVKRTLAIVQTKLDELKPLGYSCAGTVLAVGDGVTEFQAGDRVACAGAGVANHAEIVSVPVNLAAKIPGDLDGASASFATLGAIAMQGVRRADLRLGETVCVIGLGLLGQLTVQLARAAGCRVVGLDPDAARVALAERNGLVAGTSETDRLKALVSQLSGGHGADATIITASTASNDPARLSFHVTRKKGRIVVVGAVGMDLERSPFYEKEQDFLISCSYGPGRYDASYEAGGVDYPFAYVRWTENRNMSSFLELAAAKRLDVTPLIDKTFPLSRAEEAYAALQAEGPKPLGVVLSYDTDAGTAKRASIVKTKASPGRDGKVRVGLIGVGNFVKTTHLPNLRALDAKCRIAGVCAATSASASTIARQTGAALVSTDHVELLRSPDIDAVVISTRHDNHAALTLAALKAGKHVFVEKPLALTSEEVRQIEETLASLSPAPVLMVGFNRRFAPRALELFARTGRRAGPLVATYRVNAGALPAGHWANTAEGGGRLRGEACHMIDFFQALVGQPIVETSLTALRAGTAPARPDENFSAQFRFEDGSLCDLVYTSVGGASLPKERVEVHWDGQSAVLDDFKSLELFSGKRSEKAGAQDKGHFAAMDRFLEAVRGGGPMPISWSDLRASAEVAIELDAHAWGKSGGVCAES